MITLFHIFYNQHQLLRFHFASWNKHPQHGFEYLIVDDCSPRAISNRKPSRSLRIARITEDIPWNIAGARNLGFHLAKTEWVLCADIDHIVTPTAAQKILKLDLSNPDVVYTFRRRRAIDGRRGCPAIINILMNKERFFEVGGYDEDFSGNYGKEETFFAHCLRRNNITVKLEEQITFDWYPRLGRTKKLSRDNGNETLFRKKRALMDANKYKNGKTLRFNWTEENLGDFKK